MPHLTRVVHPQCQHLDFQLKTNWCWAATASNVAICDGKNIHQCTIAGNSLPGYSVSCATEQCNTPYFLSNALRTIGKFGQHRCGRMPRSAVREEIDLGRPVGVRIAWRDSDDGHFILIVGYGFQRRSRNNFYYLVFDPAVDQGFQAMSGNRLESIDGYNGTGTWSETILVN